MGVRTALPAAVPARAGRLRAGPDLVAAACSAVGASIVVVLALHLWDMNPRVPLVFGGDATFNVALIKGILEHGWFLANPDLGAPFGQHLQDFAAFNGDLTQILLIKVLGIGLSNPAAVANALYLLTYPLVALVTYVVLRGLGVSRAVSTAVTIVYTVLPYHLEGGLGRLFLVAYWGVPIACYLAIALLMGWPLAGRRPGAGRLRSHLTGRSAVTGLLLVVIACSDAYYASFAAALLLLATVVGAVVRRSRTTLLHGVVVTAVLLIAIAATQLPTIIDRAQNGDNPAVGQRQPQETQYAGLSLTDLVLPVQGHRIKGLADLTSSYQQTSSAPQSEHTQALGIVGTLGLLWLALTLVAAALAPARWGFLQDRRHASAAIGAGITFLIGTVGGLGTLFAYVVSPQLRSLGRISIFVAFFALLGVALVLDRLRRRLGPAPRRRTAFAALLGVIVVVAVLDQASPHLTPPYAAAAADYGSDAAFVAEIQHMLPPGAALFQLPYMSFPENGSIAKMDDYDGFRGYLHSTRLRWSYGAMKGRPASWAGAVVRNPTDLMLREVTAVGFAGIWVDTAGYPDQGAGALGQLGSALGEAPLRSPNGRMAFFPLAAYAERLRRTLPPSRIATLREVALAPVTPQYGPGFYGPEQFANHPGRWAQDRATIDLFNPSSHARTVKLSATVKSPASPASHVVVERPDGSRVTLVTSPDGAPLNVVMTSRPGHNPVHIATDAARVPSGGDTRNLRLELIDVSVSYPGL